jgi:hypothetical protein
MSKTIMDWLVLIHKQTIGSVAFCPTAIARHRLKQFLNPSSPSRHALPADETNSNQRRTIDVTASD